MTKSIFEETITRRRVLTGGVACTLQALVPRRSLRALTAQDSTNKHIEESVCLDLYAFPGLRQNTTSIAVSWINSKFGGRHLSDHAKVRIHAGDRDWEIELPTAVAQLERKIGDTSVFTGTMENAERRKRVVVIDLSSPAITTNGSMNVWAEHFSLLGIRHRIGTPFLSELVRDNHDLASLYHASTPADDRTVLLEPLSAVIAERFHAKGFASNVENRAVRLASALLPDVLRYDPNYPTGFTFAAQNGRHPSEDTTEVVAAILNGGISAPVQSHRTHHGLSILQFDYFQRLASV